LPLVSDPICTSSRYFGAVSQVDRISQGRALARRPRLNNQGDGSSRPGSAQELIERAFQCLANSQRTNSLHPRYSLADCRAQRRKFLTNVSVVRVAKFCGDLMDRCGVNRFEGLFQDFLQSSDFANPGRSRLLHQWLWPDCLCRAAILWQSAGRLDKASRCFCSRAFAQPPTS